MTRESLRQTFGEDAELYDRVRPTYPPELFDDLAGIVGDHPRVLEIGPGTGQATSAMVDRGWPVTAVELSPDLAGVLKRRLPGIEVIVADFDTWDLPAQTFELVVSATAFHWLDPATRMQRCVDVLRPGGALAVVSTHHVAGGSEQLFADVQSCYDRFTDDATTDGLPAADDVPNDPEGIERSGLFGSVEFRRYVWDVDYSAAQYLELLSSYSGHRALTIERRDRLYDCIGARIEAAGGSITKRYLNQLSVGISLNQPLA
ncbi:class I SAM-dependent methyltransferase [Kribbella jiaozuonensis]|uniref:Class I SAM-dependent methyltransferase n=1 Tax=Kribbella jiaozuonensis TaxID=2575441 RepID=A0A4U3M6X2_9ACTN|nr:class I SAM-dependent methyltransferase [Kribbella jiaozuonensis]TKK79127.1 class I SAM-dependent methyltransferase [Kribbella jiaozuonensis]TKK83197.1 class I SAM-dependent methyltransferase [Kribbella jiaozuonensis]